MRRYKRRVREISVIIPVYNVKPHLFECIESVSKQTFKDIEIILVDDGSTDGSGEVCDCYQKQDERICVIHQKNQGLSAARNTGLEKSSGRYIFFLDSDDYITEDGIEKLIRAINETNADIVCADYIYKYDDKETLAKSIDVEKTLTRDEAVLNLLYGEIQTFAWGRLYKRSVIGTLRFPEGKLFEDHFWTHQVFYAAHNITMIPEPLVYYRQRKNSISYTASVERLDILDGWSARMRFLEVHYPQEEEHYREWLAEQYISLCYATLLYYRKKLVIQAKRLRAFAKKEKLLEVENRENRKGIERYQRSVFWFMAAETIKKICLRLERKI